MPGGHVFTSSTELKVIAIVDLPHAMLIHEVNRSRQYEA